MRFNCHQCDGIDIDIDRANLTDEDYFEKLIDARDAHLDSHIVRPEVTHIRKQINPRRIRTGNQFYKNRVQLGAAENGSQTLCGAEPTIEDMSYGDTRYAKNLEYVTCETCKGLREVKNLEV